MLCLRSKNCSGVINRSDVIVFVDREIAFLLMITNGEKIIALPWLEVRTKADDFSFNKINDVVNAFVYIIQRVPDNLLSPVAILHSLTNRYPLYGDTLIDGLDLITSKSIQNCILDYIMLPLVNFNNKLNLWKIQISESITAIILTFEILLSDKTDTRVIKPVPNALN